MARIEETAAGLVAAAREGGPMVLGATPSRARSDAGRGRLAERAEARVLESMRSHGSIMIVLAGLMVLRLVVFVAFSSLLVFRPTDPLVFQMVIVIDSALGVALDLVIVFVALILFATVRRVETESDRMQVFMDSVYRRLP